jgi:hypothetical protein
MLLRAQELSGYTIRATDGDVGTVCNCLFDDKLWTLRYLVVETGNWLSGRRVLISPASFGEPDKQWPVLPVLLTKEQVRNSPDVDTDLPVSRQREIAMNLYYGWPDYVAAEPEFARRAAIAPLEAEELPGDPHLRSARDVIGYRIQTRDGDLGHVEDFIVDTQMWVIRYMVIDTLNWLPGKKVLVAPEWIEQVSWPVGTVTVGLPREQVASSPEYDPAVSINRVYEEELYAHYGRRGYWE